MMPDPCPSIDGKVAVFGIGGQVGSALTLALGEKAIPIGREAVDLSEPLKVSEMLFAVKPAAVINAAAYTAVDKAEQEEDLATAINADSPAIMADYCSTHNIPFLHYSTDYVFNGEGDRPWVENDIPAPLSAYGRSKLAGERKLAEIGGKHLVFRTSWVFDAFHTNFFNTMLRLGREREEIAVVGDQFGAPTYGPHLAGGSLAALERAVRLNDFPSGIYHMAAEGLTTWKDFAEAIFEGALESGILKSSPTVRAITSEEFGAPAKRPKNSRLSMEKLKWAFGIALPDWRDGLAHALEIKREAARHAH